MTAGKRDPVEVEIAKLDYEHFKADALGRFNSVDEFARGALRGLTLGNGGAIVALFTFIGNEGAMGHYDSVNSLKDIKMKCDTTIITSNLDTPRRVHTCEVESVKKGEWLYYNEAGKIIKKEEY